MVIIYLTGMFAFVSVCLFVVFKLILGIHMLNRN